MAGWIIALTANYLGGLDTGSWMPLVVSAVQLIALSLVFAGVRKLKDQHPNFGRAGIAAALAIAAVLGIGLLQLYSMETMSPWISIAAICLTLAGDVLFLLLTGLVLLGAMKQDAEEPQKDTGFGLRYKWVLFLAFDILYIVIQSLAVLLTNENLPALTYVVPAMGLPVLVTGAMIAVGLYRIHPKQA